MRPTIKFVKLSDMLSQISKQNYFTPTRLWKLYEETIREYEKTQKIKINPLIENGKKTVIGKHKLSLVDEIEGEIYLKPDIAKTIEDYFYDIKNSEINNLEDTEYDEGVERRGLVNLIEWKQIHGDVIETDYSRSSTFIPQVQIKSLDLNIALKESGTRIKILQNPLIKNDESRPFDEYNYNMPLQRLKIKVLRGIKNGNKMDTFNLVYQKKFMCSRCRKTHFRYDYQSHQLLKCYCVKKIDKNGHEIITAHTTLKSGLIDVGYSIYLYEIGIGWNKKNISTYMYSMEKLDRGQYYSDIVTSDQEIEGNKGTVPIIMGSVKKNKVQIGNEIFEDSNDRIELEVKRLNIPNINILKVLYGARKLIKKYGIVEINNKGYLLQLFITISAIAKHRYGFNKLAISVIGNSGLSKTYSGELLAKILDPDSIIIGNGKNLTYSGIIGGINNGGINVGGNRITTFEEGIATSGGLVILDEASVYYSDPEINTSLKNLLDSTIRIAKVGSPKEEIPNNYTPIILCNFPIDHKKKYTQKIRENYKKLLRKYPHDLHNIDEKSIEKYLSQQNFYLPIQYYVEKLKNPTLARTISYVRKVCYTNSQIEIDWRTGGSIPSANRILFDIVCNNDTKDRAEERIVPQSPILPDKTDLPAEEYVEILKSWNKKYDINLMELNKNSKKINKKIEALKQSIHHFLAYDKRGDKIYTALAWGDKGKNIDDRLEGEVYVMALVLQLFEDEDSTELSENVKQFIYLMLIKCKRGITEDEYNFINHYEKIENVDYDVTEIEMLMKEVDEEQQLEKDLRLEILKDNSKGMKKDEDQLDDFGLEGNKIE